MPEKLSALPWLIKLLALVAGGVICLILSGDIDTKGRIKISCGVILKFACSVFIGLYCGEFIIDHLDWEHMNHFAQGAILMMFSVFGMLVFGIVYRAVQLTLQEKTLSEIVSEIKQTISAILK